MVLRLRLLLCWLLTAHFSYGVDFDYYFSALRSENVCNNVTEKLKCQLKCGQDTGMCVGKECFCLSVRRFKELGSKGKKDKSILLSMLLKRNKDDQRYSDVHDYNELPEVHYERSNADSSQVIPEYLDESLLHNKPALRHHIAHFCPNLDVARTCIRTCMKEGKPAFCGKDHVCYCGHKYSNKDINSDVDPASVYGQFKDLYEKYFGPNYKEELKA